jgi:hypothetical protein
MYQRNLVSRRLEDVIRREDNTTKYKSEDQYTQGGRFQGQKHISIKR